MRLPLPVSKCRRPFTPNDPAPVEELPPSIDPRAQVDELIEAPPMTTRILPPQMPAVSTTTRKKALAHERPSLQGRESGPLRVVYASTHDPSDMRTWSGLVYFIARSLEQQGIDVDYLGQLQYNRLLLNKAVNRAFNLLGDRGPLPIERSERMAKRFAKEIAQHMASDSSSVIFSPSSIPLAHLRTDRPKVFYTDCTFGDLLEQYPEFNEYPSDMIAEGHALEREALQNCDMAIYSSTWAARSAIDRYGADPDKVKVVPFGSNLSIRVSAGHVLQQIPARGTKCCELLFLGVNWERKGGPLAFEVARMLNDIGMPARLTVVGCEPPKEFQAPFVHVLPFIDKNDPWGQRRIINLLLSSHFLLLPTLADCTPVVFSEASAMGVPILSRDVGGISDIVHDGKNGFLFDMDEGAEAYVARIVDLMSRPKDYVDLATASLREYEQRLNWKVSGAALSALLRSLL